MRDYQKHLDSFYAHLILKNFSKATRKSYMSALRRFFEYRLNQKIFGNFTQEQARSYILERHSQGCKWQTINGDYSAICKFYREVIRLGWDVQHIPRPRRERTLPALLSQEAVQKIIEHGAMFKHQVFMTLLYCTGLRLSEALRLRLADVNGERLQLRMVKGKGAKDRYIDVPIELIVYLRRYYQKYKP